jgi:hypothetical protein
MVKEDDGISVRNGCDRHTGFAFKHDRCDELIGKARKNELWIAVLESSARSPSACTSIVNARAVRSQFSPLSIGKEAAAKSRDTTEADVRHFDLERFDVYVGRPRRNVATVENAVNENLADSGALRHPKQGVQTIR